MDTWTSDELRARYRAIHNIILSKLIVNNYVDLKSEFEEIMEVSRILFTRGYIPNDNSNDWILKPSTNSWQAEDENEPDS